MLDTLHMTLKLPTLRGSTGFLLQFPTKTSLNFKAKCVHALLKCQRRQFLSGEKLMDFLESIFCLAGLVGWPVIHLLTATSLALHSVPKQNKNTFL